MPYERKTKAVFKLQTRSKDRMPWNKIDFPYESFEKAKKAQVDYSKRCNSEFKIVRERVYLTKGS